MHSTVILFNVCRVLHRSQVSLVLKHQSHNLISEQGPKWTGTLTGESCVFGLSSCLDRSQRGQICSALSTALPHLASQEQLQSNKQCVAWDLLHTHLWLFALYSQRSGQRNCCLRMVFLEYLDRGSTLSFPFITVFFRTQSKFPQCFLQWETKHMLF